MQGRTYEKVTLPGIYVAMSTINSLRRRIALHCVEFGEISVHKMRVICIAGSPRSAGLEGGSTSKHDGSLL